jgi:hypothetical protein
MSTEATGAAAPAAATTLITAPAAAAPAAGAAPAGSTPAAGDAGAAAPAAGTPAAGAAAPAAGAAAPAAGAPGEAGQPGEGDAGKTPEQIEADRVAAEAAAAEAAKNAGAPEKYEPFNPPEGATLDQAVMDQFAEAARELNLPQDKAQQLIDKMAPTIAARQAEQIETLRTEWHTQATTDNEFGGDKLAENLAVAKRAVDAFATPELTKLLNDTGLGNHPEVIRFMVRTGKAMSEDKVVTGGVPAATGQRSAADTLYPTSALKK